MDARVDHDRGHLVDEITEITEELLAGRGDYSREGVWARGLLCACLKRRLDVLQGAAREPETD